MEYYICVLKLSRQYSTTAWGCTNCPVVFMIEAHCNHMGFNSILISHVFEIFSYFVYSFQKIGTNLLSQTGNITDHPLDMHQENQFRFPYSKSEKSHKWKQFLTSFVIKRTWHIRVDNSDMGFWNRDKNCTEFAFHRCCTNRKSSKNDSMIPTRICMECDNRSEYCHRYS